MNKLWKAAPALVLFGAIAMAAAPTGCVQAEAPFFIEGARVQDCDGFSPDSATLLGGVMDVRYSCGYSVNLVLGNQLVRRGDAAKSLPETSRITIKSFDVEILGADGAALDTGTGAGAFTIPATGFIDPGTGTEPGYGVSGTLLIDGATAQYLAGQGGGLVIASVVAHGRTLGGDDISTAPWEFPIDVCDGCLCSEPSDDTCVGSDNTPEGECYIPQDQRFDCRFIGADCSTPGLCGVLQ